MSIYLDNNATTALAPQAFEAMLPFLRDYYGNPSSIHDFGKPVARAIETARLQLAGLLRADMASEIVFTSGATEANNTAILSAIEAQPQRREIITSAVEHPAVLALCDHLASRGYVIHRIGVDSQGRLDRAAFSAALSERAGNAPLDEVVVAAEELLAVDTGVNLALLPQLALAVARASGEPLNRRKSLSGRDVFTHESGTHVAAMLRDPASYSAIDPRRLGREHQLVLGKHSGRSAIVAIYAGLGLELASAEIAPLRRALAQYSEQHKCSPQAAELQALLLQVRQRPHRQLPNYSTEVAA